MPGFNCALPSKEMSFSPVRANRVNRLHFTFRECLYCTVSLSSFMPVYLCTVILFYDYNIV